MLLFSAFLHPKSAALPFSVVVMERSFLHSIPFTYQRLNFFCVSFFSLSLSFYLNFTFHGIDALRISTQHYCNRLNLQIKKNKSKTNKKRRGKDEHGKYLFFASVASYYFRDGFVDFVFFLVGFCGQRWTYLI